MSEPVVASAKEGVKDPLVLDWDSIELPNTWADEINFKTWTNVGRLWCSMLKKGNGRIELPDDFPDSVMSKELLPKYLLQEFHGIPNGNFSNHITQGYIRTFDGTMLGKMKPVRKEMAYWFDSDASVLDIGCAGGQMAAALKDRGVEEVWGLDPSPYLLKHAAKANPKVHFVQGLAEDLQFADKRFDGITASFLFHEIPPKHIDKALNECHRVLDDGGLLAICEPSFIQFKAGWWQMFKGYGFTGLYFKWLAGHVYEPFVPAWHKQDIDSLLNKHGFEVLINRRGMPEHRVLARKR
ncbi:class I SAM-dependent methyltransferase [Shewanella sp. D64]|uniref:class I SAM-dependent methyltransferase n=1 Tax=unclassified Shewanella TaxID=196818 RepID=UPI0022BA7109|nr:MULTISPECIES: class I SAM-dependent methyltransferase [unclassified Shewanella]MEC4727976.1 class I SAM-dependent methyltransferase [Shewanella sp. D64]MEC4740052.1 class I SAM-dependent methyltransferase [Shewanella sp. E94]WBJ95822.1 class I SAM-dependent methyltransferase [Shewanella sp. MTB7]